MNHSVTLSRSIKAAPEAVFRALTTPTGLLDWCANAVQLDTSKGSYFYLWSDSGYQLTGAVGNSTADSEIEWQISAPEMGLFRFKIQSGDEQTAQLSFSLYGDFRTDQHIAFWNEALNNLKSVLETGLDRRIYDRPMLGILIGGLLDRESQARYGSPVPFGVIVSGTVAGMGAAKLGLTEGDILFEMDGVELRDFRDLQRVIGAYRAGEAVRVSWYRAGERHTGLLTFSGRPEPVIPASPVELADYIQELYAHNNAELAELLDGATEPQTDYRPLENEWNVKEIIAHMIATDRAAQLWISATLAGVQMGEWGTNDHALVQAIVATYASLPDLQEELFRTQAQTLALLRRLPPELVNHKGTYTMIVTMFGEQGLPIHTRMHFDTIRSLLANAPA